MGFLALEQPPGIPHLALKLLKVVGIGGEPKGRYRILPTMIVFLLVIAVPKIFFGYPNFELTIIGLAELNFEFNTYCGLFLIFLHNDQLTALVDEARKFSRNALEESPVIVQNLTGEHRRIHEASKAYFLAVMYAAHVYSISPFCFTFLSYVGTLMNENATIHYTLHLEENFYGLAIRTSIVHYLLYGIILCPTCYLCAFISATRTVGICSFIRYCTAYFQLVQRKVEDVALNNTFGRDVKAVVKMHEQALNCTKHLETVLSEVFLLQFTMCIFIWSFMLLYFTVSGINVQLVNLFVLFLVHTTETFGYCYLGNQLSDESALVAQAVYDNGWETQSPAIQKELQLVLLRAQKPVGITAGKFCFVNMERFGKLVKTAYSFFIVLKDQI